MLPCSRCTFNFFLFLSAHITITRWRWGCSSSMLLCFTCWGVEGNNSGGFLLDVTSWRKHGSNCIHLWLSLSSYIYFFALTNQSAFQNSSHVTFQLYHSNWIILDSNVVNSIEAKNILILPWCTGPLWLHLRVTQQLVDAS